MLALLIEAPKQGFDLSSTVGCRVRGPCSEIPVIYAVKQLPL
jgi:hypothetical protein